MIDNELFERLASLDKQDLEIVKLRVLSGLQDEQMKFARGEISELELIAYTRAVNGALAEIPLDPMSSQSHTKASVGSAAAEAEAALLERSREL